MEINQLKYFLEVCNCGSMAKAAEKLHITQQGISIALRRLESSLAATPLTISPRVLFLLSSAVLSAMRRSLS